MSEDFVGRVARQSEGEVGAKSFEAQPCFRAGIVKTKHGMDGLVWTD